MRRIVEAVRDAFRTEEECARQDMMRAFRQSERYQNHLKRIENLGGYYRGDRRGRGLGEWTTSGQDANEMLSPSLSDLRNDSNDLYVNSALAAGAVDTYVTNVIGTGLKLNPSIDHEALGLTPEQADEWHAQVEREYQLFAKTCDITRMSSMAEIQQIVFRSVLLSGDILVNLPMVSRPGVVYQTAINLIEGHRLSNPDGAMDSESQIMGVELDGNGAPKFFHYSTGGAYGTPKRWNKLKVFDAAGERACLHVFRKKRPNQVRGVPILAPIIELLKKLDTYSQAEIEAAVINSFFTVFVKKRAPEAGGLPFDGITNMGAETGAKGSDKEVKLGPATIVELFEDEEGVEFANPQRPNVNFEAFFRALVGEIAVGLNMPYEILMKVFQASYSASRGALIEALKVFKEWEDFMITEFCQPVYEAFLYEAVLRGRIKAPGFLEDPLVRLAYSMADWIGQEQAELDPVKAADAADKRIATGTSNIIIETQARGKDYGKVLRGSQRAQRMRGQDANPRPDDKSRQE